MAGASVTEQIKDFIRAIELRDPAGVEAALKNKVSADTPISDQYHPLFFLLNSDYTNSSSDVQQTMTPDQYQQNTAAIIDLLFKYGAKVAENEKYETREFRTLADRLLFSDHFIDATTVMLHAIRETAEKGQPAYTPDITKSLVHAVGFTLMMAQRNGSKPDIRETISDTLNRIERLHDIVRQRIENPETDIEREVAEKYKAQAAPWLTDFVRPTLKEVMETIAPAVQSARPKTAAPKDAGNENDGLSGTFGKGSGPVAVPEGYIRKLERKEPGEIIGEMKTTFAALDGEIASAESLINAARFAQAVAGGSKRNYSEAIVGPEGTGKSTLAAKRAELLFSLGLAGANYVEFTKENSAGPSENIPVEALAKLFAKADIINIELTDVDFTLRNPMANFSLRLISALKASMQGRKDKPLVFITGKAQTVKEVFEENPELEPIVPKFRTIGEPAPEDLVKIFRLKMGKKFDIGDAELKTIEKAFFDIRKELGNEFTNARAVERLADEVKDRMGNRLLAGGAMPSGDQLYKVEPQDVNGIDFYSVLAGATVAKKQGIGFGARVRNI